MEHSCLRNNFGSNRRTYSELGNLNISIFAILLCLLLFKICFCRDILPPLRVNSIRVVSSFKKRVLELSSLCSSFFIRRLFFSKSPTKCVQLSSDATSFSLSVNKHRLNFNLSFILFNLHLTNHGAASANTKNWILNGKRSLSLFRLHFIHSFEVDI